jgi:hypothetical protein
MSSVLKPNEQDDGLEAAVEQAMARQFTHYQQGIEAIDRAIADEEKLERRGQ